MRQLKIHVLYEHGVDPTPFSSAQIRLLRPLAYPSLKSYLRVTPDLDYEGQNVDAVIVDRLWRPNISPALLENLLKRVSQAGAKLIYAVDDNFLDLPAEESKWAGANRLWAVKFLLEHAHGILVTTQPLKERLLPFNENIAVIPHALDEQLLPKNILRKSVVKYLRRFHRSLLKALSPGHRKIVIGWMGTPTHDKDLEMIAPALRAVDRRYPDKIEVQLLGVVKQTATLEALAGLPIRVINLSPALTVYPEFMPWFCTYLQWDLAVAPLRDTPFNRCKSDIKFLDYSALGAAGIYSRVPAYETNVRHLQMGWLAENCLEAWIEALAALITDKALRKMLAQNATRYLHQERVLARCALNWPRTLERLLAY